MRPHMESIEEWRVWSEASIEWSERRREQNRHSRTLDRIYLAPAVLGAIIMIFWLQTSFPIETWYVGLLAVILIVPYLTRRIS